MKTDKYAILTDAIKYLKQVQSEHSQLKQLNKFLEVSSMVVSNSKACMPRSHACTCTH